MKERKIPGDLWETRPSLYVSTVGSDAWSGTSGDRALATMEGARDALAAMRKTGKLPPGPVVVELLEGTYQLTRPFTLTEEDSGTEGAPIVYRAARGAKVVLVGGKLVKGFAPVTDPDVMERLDPAARGNVVQTSLPDQGVADFGKITAPTWTEGQPGLELFFRGKRMTLARWPNEGFVKIVSIDVPGNTPLINRVTRSGKVKACQEGRFVYEGDRPSRWVNETDGWLHGHWFWDWADQRMRIASIDEDKRVITLEGEPHRFGFRDGQWYYALNLLCELDRPGEWYLDRESGTLYFWPPEPMRDGDASVSIAPVLIDLRGASHVAFHGMAMDGVRGTAVAMSGGTGNTVSGCTIRNASGWGVRAMGGTGHGVVGCDLYELGEGGIALKGGERASLTSGGHYAEDNHIHHCSRWNPLYYPGITLDGVGLRASHNLIHDLPHSAIGFTGNDHLIEYNEIHNVVSLANDAGAIYTFVCNHGPTEELSMYGHIIRHNYVHHLSGYEGRGCNGAVYLDDFFPGTTIYGNVFYRVPRAAFVGGGRHNVIENNVFIDCSPSLHIDARGLGWAAGSEEELIRLLKALPYQGPLWSRRYPTLVNVLENDPMVPKGNVVARNICWRGSWDEVEEKARPYATFVDNLTGVDPLFVDEDAGNFALREDSPAFALGFRQIPFSRIGLRADVSRPSG